MTAGMDNPIGNRDPLSTLHNAFKHLLGQAKAVNDDDVDELRAHNVCFYLERERELSAP